MICLLCSHASRAVRGKSLPTTSSRSTCSKMEDLHPLIFDMLCHLGPSLHSDPILMAKLLRLGRLFFKERSSIRATGELLSEEKVSTMYIVHSLTNGYSRPWPQFCVWVASQLAVFCTVLIVKPELCLSFIWNYSIKECVVSVLYLEFLVYYTVVNSCCRSLSTEGFLQYWMRFYCRPSVCYLATVVWPRRPGA